MILLARSILGCPRVSTCSSAGRNSRLGRGAYGRCPRGDWSACHHIETIAAREWPEGSHSWYEPGWAGYLAVTAIHERFSKPAGSAPRLRATRGHSGGTVTSDAPASRSTLRVQSPADEQDPSRNLHHRSLLAAANSGDAARCPTVDAFAPDSIRHGWAPLLARSGTEPDESRRCGAERPPSLPSLLDQVLDGRRVIIGFDARYNLISSKSAAEIM